jgi:hypothetical protein
MERYFASDRHALYCGWVAMRASMSGLTVKVVDDGRGNYTPKLAISLGAAEGQPAVDVVFSVPEPPEDWTP